MCSWRAHQYVGVGGTAARRLTEMHCRRSQAFSVAKAAPAKEGINNNPCYVSLCSCGNMHSMYAVSSLDTVVNKWTHVSMDKCMHASTHTHTHTHIHTHTTHRARQERGCLSHVHDTAHCAVSPQLLPALSYP